MTYRRRDRECELAAEFVSRTGLAPDQDTAEWIVRAERNTCRGLRTLPLRPGERWAALERAKGVR